MVNPEQIARKLFAAVNRRDLDAVASAVSPNFRMFFTGQPDIVKSREEYRRHWEDFYKEHPDVKTRVLNVIAGDGKAVVELEMKYTVKSLQGSKHAKTERVKWAAFCSIDPEGLVTVASLENTRKVTG